MHCNLSVMNMNQLIMNKHRGEVLCCIFTDDNELISAGHDHRIFIWRNFYLTSEFVKYRVLSFKHLSDTDFNKDRPELVMRAGKLVNNDDMFTEDDEAINCICKSALRKGVFYAGTNKGQVFIIDLFKDKVELLYATGEDEINHISCSETGWLVKRKQFKAKEEKSQHPHDMLFISNDDSHVLMYDVANGILLNTINQPSNIVTCTVTRPNFHQEIFIGSMDSCVYMYDLASRRTRVVLSMDNFPPDHNVGNAIIPSLVHSISFSEHGHLIAIGCENTMLHIFNGITRNTVHLMSIIAHKSAVILVKFFIYEGIEYLLSAGNDRLIKIWRPYNKTPISVKLHNSKINAIDIKLDLDCLAVADVKGKVYVYSMPHILRLKCESCNKLI